MSDWIHPVVALVTVVVVAVYLAVVVFLGSPYRKWDILAIGWVTVLMVYATLGYLMAADVPSGET